MRIALVTTSWPADADDPAGHFVRTEARQYAREGHEVAIFAPKPGGAFGWPGVAARVRARPWRLLEALRWVATTQRAIARGHFDRVVAHWAVPSAWPIASTSGAPLEVVSHGGDVRLLARMPARARRFVVRQICERATSWQFVSDALLHELLACLGPNEARTVSAMARVAPCAISVPDVRAAGSLRRAEHVGRRVAVCVARLVRAKRIDAVIDHVARTAPGSLLVVVGDGPDRARLEKHARARAVEARFVGKIGRTEALTWMASADVLVHASRAEGLSTVIREAEILGLRVERA